MINLTCTDLLSKYYGETEAKIRSIFQRAKAAAPCILFFDHFEAIAHRRKGNQDADGDSHSMSATSGNIGNRILSTFLNELDGVTGERNHQYVISNDSQVFVIAACSSLELLDEALIRPG
jgi:SpoVK/Ycf46/Vps4 family AAA+-type ATPase